MIPSRSRMPAAIGIVATVLLATLLHGVPASTPWQGPEVALADAPQGTRTAVGVTTYTVKRGDTLWSVGRRFGVTVEAIARANSLPDPNMIRVGQRLAIPRSGKGLPKARAVLYFLNQSPGEFFLAPEERWVPTGGNLYVTVMRELVAGPITTPGAWMPIPRTTRIRSVVVRDSVAYVNFTPDLLKMNVGAPAEGLVLNAIANTLTEYREIGGVRILVDGGTVETIGGHIAATGILRRNLRPVRYK